jgi:hypothetical protein
MVVDSLTNIKLKIQHPSSWNKGALGCSTSCTDEGRR